MHRRSGIGGAIGKGEEQLAETDGRASLIAALAKGGNALLAAAAPADLEELAARGTRRSFGRGDLLVAANQPAGAAYFIERGIASVVKVEERRQTEVCLLGPEGFTGGSIILADGCSPYQTMVQADELAAFEVSAGDLKDVAARSPNFCRILLNALHVQTVQIAENLVSAAWQKISERLARWLLMYRDRIGSPQLEVTHEFMAIMIGAQRSKVTIALHELEAAKAIVATRGRVIVTNAALLQQLANGSYGCAEREAERMSSVMMA